MDPVSTLHPTLRRQPGFTLVELLVVIAILVILAGLLLPVVTTAKRKANVTESLSNLRQIASAMIFFATDHDGHLPLGDQYHIQLQSYLQNVLDAGKGGSVFVSENADRKPVIASNYNIPVTYSMHGRMTGEGNVPGLGQPMNLMRFPAKLILVGDGTQRPNNFYQANWRFREPEAYVFGDYEVLGIANATNAVPYTGPDDLSNDAMGWLRYCNDGAVACAFGDGHAGLIRKGDVLAENLVAW